MLLWAGSSHAAGEDRGELSLHNVMGRCSSGFSCRGGEGRGSGWLAACSPCSFGASLGLLAQLWLPGRVQQVGRVRPASLRLTLPSPRPQPVLFS